MVVTNCSVEGFFFRLSAAAAGNYSAVVNMDANAPAANRSAWSLAGEMLRRPFPLRARVVVPALMLMVLVPCYLVIPALTRGRTLHLPEMALDRMVPVQPAWAVIYLSYFLFL